MKRKVCKEFKKKENGLCGNYIGCKKEVVTCANECVIGGYREDKCKDGVCKL